MNSPGVPLASQWSPESSFVLLHAGVRVRKVLDLEFGGLLVLLFGDDDVSRFKVLSLGWLDTRRLDEEFRVGLALLGAFTSP